MGANESKSQGMPEKWRSSRRKSDTVFYKPGKGHGTSQPSATGETLSIETPTSQIEKELTISFETKEDDSKSKDSGFTTFTDDLAPPRSPYPRDAPESPCVENLNDNSAPSPVNNEINADSIKSKSNEPADAKKAETTPDQTTNKIQSSAPLTKAEKEVDDWIERLLRTARHTTDTNSFILNSSEISEICQKARAIFLSQPPLLRVSGPIKVVGDTHGQFTDLVRLFDLCGYPSQSSYLFLGDYVDRGKQSLETILLLFCYKIRYPDKMFILRGNHECANVNRVYGFFDECKRRCSIKIWKTFTDVFNCLPLAAIISDKIFCVHGGLSPSLKKMNEISSIRRPTEIPEEGLLNDLLWSDPSDQTDEWLDNDRGVSVVFGKKVVEEFLTRHRLDLVCRAHMVVEDGYEFFANRQLVTVFSAPNYCGEFQNNAAIMNVNQDLVCSFEILRPANYRSRKISISK